MAFREVGSAAVTETSQSELEFVKLQGMQAGTVLAAGTYTGAREFGKGENKSLCYLINQDDGVTKALNAWGKLKHLMTSNNVNEGTVVRVTYGGMGSITKGPQAGRAVHDFKLEIDDEA